MKQLPSKPFLQKTALITLFFFCLQIFGTVPLYAIDSGANDMHEGTPAGETSPAPDKGDGGEDDCQYC